MLIPIREKMRGARILIVDPDLATASGVQAGLSIRGYTIAGALDSLETAFQQIPALNPDIVLMNTAFEREMDGIEAGQKITERFRIPVLYLCTDEPDGAIERAAVTGAFGLIGKPVNVTQLHAAIQLVLQGHPNELLWSVADRVTGYAIFSLDEQGNIGRCSDSSERMTGYERNELLGQSFAILFTQHDRLTGVPEHELRRAAEEGQSDDDRWLVRKTGERYWAEGILTPVKNESGIATAFIKVVRDATYQKHAMDRLQDRLTGFHMALQAAGIGTWRYDVASRTFTLNPSMASLCGFPEEKKMLPAENLYALGHRDDLSSMRKALQGVLARASIECRLPVRVARSLRALVGNPRQNVSRSDRQRRVRHRYSDGCRAAQTWRRCTRESKAVPGRRSSCHQAGFRKHQGATASTQRKSLHRAGRGAPPGRAGTSRRPEPKAGYPGNGCGAAKAAVSPCSRDSIDSAARV